MSMNKTLTIPVIDISAITSKESHLKSDECNAIAKSLIQHTHEQGYIGIKGHGIPKEMLSQAFSLMKLFFNMPMEDKMKAPHPQGWIPHRGYLWPGFEKAFTKEDMEAEDEEYRKKARQIVDYKESFEIGSQENKTDTNIWPPDDLIPGFEPFMLELYWRLHALCLTLLDAFITGLGLNENEKQTIQDLHAGHTNHLRLLHYPPIAAEKIGNEMLGRCPAHTDMSTFTILFQDSCGGLEFENRKSPGTFVPAVPVEGTLYLNVGDMLTRLSNDYLPASNHRVVIPSNNVRASNGDGLDSPSRYSLPYFFNPNNEGWVEPQQTCVNAEGQKNYEGITTQDYKAWRMKWIYQK